MPDGATLYMKGSSVGTGASTCATGSAAGITDTSAGKNADKQAKKALTKLISKGMSGDEGAFIALFERSVKEIYYLANALLDNKAETDDVVQEVAIALYKGMTKLQSPYAFTSFLVAATRNVCMSHNRKQMRHRHDSIDKDELDVFRTQAGAFLMTAPKSCG